MSNTTTAHDELRALLADIEGAQAGSATSCVSLYIEAGRDINERLSYVTGELATAARIKSRI